MARHLGWTLASVLTIGSVGILGQSAPPHTSSSQQTHQKPSDNHDRRRTWQNHQSDTELDLTTDQITKPDRILQKHTEKAVPLRKEVDELEKAIDQAIRTQK